MSRIPAIVRAAHAAIGFADALGRHLLMVSLPGVDADTMRTSLAKAFEAYSGLQVAMRDLEAVAPVSAETGYERAGILREGLKI